MDIENEAQHDFDDIFSTQWSYKHWSFEDITNAITPKTRNHLKNENLLIQQWMMSNSFQTRQLGQKKHVSQLVRWISKPSIVATKSMDWIEIFRFGDFSFFLSACGMAQG